MSDAIFRRDEWVPIYRRQIRVPTVVSGRTVNCTTEVLQLSTTPASVNRTRLITALTEVLELTENAASVNRTRLISALTEVLELTDNAASVNRTRLITALIEILDLTENIATVIRGGGRIVNGITEVLELNENAATVNKQRGVSAVTEVLQLNENAATVNRQRGVSAVTEVLLLSTVQASVNASRIVLGLVEALELATNSASINRTRLVTALTEVLELAENIANVIRGGGRLVNCITEVLELNENAASVSRQRGITTATEILQLTENAASVTRTKVVTGVTETLLLSTVQASVNASRSVIGLVESLLLTEQNATVLKSRLVAALTEALLLATNQANIITGVLAKFIDYKFVKQSQPKSDTVTKAPLVNTKRADRSAGWGTCASSFFDDFDRPGPSLGPNWTTPVIGPSNQRDPMEIATQGTAQPTNTANWHDAAYTGELTPDDQFAEATVAVLNGGAFFNTAFGVYVRATVNTRNAYFASLWYDTANAKRYWEWGKLQAGAAVFFGFDYFLGPVWPVGTVIRLEAIGTSFRLYIDGVLEDTGVDSEFPSGHPCMLTSISLNDQDDVQFESFRSGPIAGA